MRSLPPNCTFEVTDNPEADAEVETNEYKIDDLEKEWTWTKPFDFIFSRFMTGSFANNGAMVKKAFEYVISPLPGATVLGNSRCTSQLEPGGYFEAQDMAVPFGCDDGTLKTDSDLWTWCLWLMQAMEAFGRPLTAAQRWKELMEAAGFEDVVERVYKWPTNPWARDQHYKMLGQWVLYNMDQVLEPAILAPMTRSLGWTREEAIMLAARARKVLRDPRVHAYWPMWVLSSGWKLGEITLLTWVSRHVVYGRKPLKSRASKAEA